MKPSITLLALTCSAALLAGLRGFAQFEEPGETSTGNSVSQANAAEMRTKLDRAAAKVRERLHMSAMLEVSDDPGEEAEIAELYHSGWIIEASVEDVEAARKAAAATPTREDDVAAETLAHRASCRFFFKE